METLLDKVKPEYLERLEEVRVEYPSSHGFIMHTLQTKSFVMNLTIEEADRMMLFTNKPLGEIFTIFNI